MTRKAAPAKKKNLHARNLHNNGYDFSVLCEVYPALKQYLVDNHQQTSINFSDPDAVLALNCALLKAYYRIDIWQIPKGYLCPPIPGRVDYIHYLAELLESTAPKLNHRKITALDIGTGASCIYPILGQRSYQWRFIASDIDPLSTQCAKEITYLNKGLSKSVNIVLQKNSSQFFDTIIKPHHKIDITLCNPPFHSSLAQALAGNQRKNNNLNKSRDNRKGVKKETAPPQSASLNFGGQKAELFCEGGELSFIQNMILESKAYQQQVLYFTCLVSKSAHLPALKKAIHTIGAADFQIIEMSQGQKISRFIVWSFHDQASRKEWLTHETD
jgi:23S rRNA (adenine1618-N6)-methyltransferase